MTVVDVQTLEARPREHSDNKHIVRRDDLKISLVSVRPGEELPVHQHDAEEQFYYILSGEGILSLGDEVCDLRAGMVVAIPPRVPHGVENPGPTRLEYLDFFVACRS